MSSNEIGKDSISEANRGRDHPVVHVVQSRAYDGKGIERFESQVGTARLSSINLRLLTSSSWLFSSRNLNLCPSAFLECCIGSMSALVFFGLSFA